MARTKKPKIVTITRPVFEIYENKFKMMEDPKHMFSENDTIKQVDYLIKKDDSLILRSTNVNLNKNGTVKEKEIPHLTEVESVDGFYGWVKSMSFETIETIELPKVKSVEDTPKKKTRKKK